MNLPNFKSRDGATNYSHKGGAKISPLVVNLVMNALPASDKANSFKNILDIGSGPGNMSLALAQRYPHADVVGIDFSEAMIDLSSTSALDADLTNVDFKWLSDDHIDQLTQHFDLIVCNLAFPFFPRPEHTMTQVFEHLRSGSQTIFTVPGNKTWAEFFDIATGVMGPMVEFARPMLSKFMQAENLPRIMRESGLLLIEEQHTLIPFTFGSGQEAVTFFTEMFEMLSKVPTLIRKKLAMEIDARFPAGFTMNYEAVMVTGKRS